MRDEKRYPEYLRVEEAAEFLNVREATIRAWLMQGKLPKVKISMRAIRIPLAALEELIERGTVPAREPDSHSSGTMAPALWERR